MTRTDDDCSIHWPLEAAHTLLLIQRNILQESEPIVVGKHMMICLFLGPSWVLVSVNMPPRSSVRTSHNECKETCAHSLMPPVPLLVRACRAFVK